MRNLLLVFILPVVLLLFGCESTGANYDAVPSTFTPGVSAETTIRTWDNGKPTVKEVPNDPAYMTESERANAQGNR